MRTGDGDANVHEARVSALQAEYDASLAAVGAAQDAARARMEVKHENLSQTYGTASAERASRVALD